MSSSGADLAATLADILAPHMAKYNAENNVSAPCDERGIEIANEINKEAKNG